MKPVFEAHNQKKEKKNEGIFQFKNNKKNAESTTKAKLRINFPIIVTKGKEECLSLFVVSALKFNKITFLV